MNNSSNRLIIFDTTLRDGEQSPGASMTKDEKVRIAKQLERLRVDVIEAGFAAASQGDFESIKAIASVVRESTICSLSRRVVSKMIRRLDELFILAPLLWLRCLKMLRAYRPPGVATVVSGVRSRRPALRRSG